MQTDLILCTYMPGDIGLVDCAEADPWEGWAGDIEKGARDLRSVMLGDKVVACFGYSLVTPGVADSFAVVDRNLSAGHGPELAGIISAQCAEWMDEQHLHRAAATCSPDDSAAGVFLRAIGYRRECTLEAAAVDGSDLVQYKLIRRKDHGQDS